MADDSNPYAKYVPSTTASAVEAENPYAKYTEQPVGTFSDVIKGVPVGLAEGAIGLAGAPGDVTKLLTEGSKAAGDYIGGKLGFPTSPDVTAKTATPTSSELKKSTEKVTGPFYEAKTPIGKGLQTAAQVAPSLALGGEGLLPTAAKAIGAGATSEVAGEAANALKGHLPNFMQPYAEPVARAVGAMGGTFAPAGLRKIATPLPMTPEQTALVGRLRATNPELVDASSAGQLTNRPGLQAVEARAPAMQGLPQRQEEAFTQGVMRTMGVDGLATPANMREGNNIGAAIGNIRNTNEINPAQFPILNREIATIVRQHRGTVGPADVQTIADIQNQIRMGAANTPNVASMTGRRYGYMRQKLQSQIDNAPTGTDSTALSGVRDALDRAFHRSIPPDVSQNLNNLETQYTNYKALTNRTPTDSNTVSPDEVRKAAARHFGNPNVNEGRNQLSPLANDASQVMTPLPKPNTEGGPGTKLLGGLIGGAGGAGIGIGTGQGLAGAGSEGLLGAFTGMSHANDVVQALKNAGARVVARPGIQNYLKNQRWMPGSATTGDTAQMLRLLMSPPEQQVISGQSK